ncbi:hypothetical protein ES703_54032 [subsurface metagenome]
MYFSLQSCAFCSFSTALAFFPMIKRPIPVARTALALVLDIFASICSLKVIMLLSLEWTNSESFQISSIDGSSSANRSISQPAIGFIMALLP